jgi:hypothetical protein
MTKKAAFNAEEWSIVAEAPLLAGMRVAAAERGGTIRESLAVGQAYASAREHQGASELLDELVGSPPAIDARRLQQSGDIVAASDERLREAVRIVGEKASADELESYRWFVRTVAEAVAQAHKEGGFLGIGGRRVSEKERAALDEIGRELGGTAP